MRRDQHIKAEPRRRVLSPLVSRKERTHWQTLKDSIQQRYTQLKSRVQRIGEAIKNPSFIKTLAEQKARFLMRSGHEQLLSLNKAETENDNNTQTPANREAVAKNKTPNEDNTSDKEKARLERKAKILEQTNRHQERMAKSQSRGHKI